MSNDAGKFIIRFKAYYHKRPFFVSAEGLYGEWSAERGDAKRFASVAEAYSLMAINSLWRDGFAEACEVIPAEEPRAAYYVVKCYTRMFDPHPYMMAGASSKVYAWSAKRDDAMRFESEAAARDYVQANWGGAVSPMCSFERVEPDAAPAVDTRSNAAQITAHVAASVLERIARDVRSGKTIGFRVSLDAKTGALSTSCDAAQTTPARPRVYFAGISDRHLSYEEKSRRNVIRKAIGASLARATEDAQILTRAARHYKSAAKREREAGRLNVAAIYSRVVEDLTVELRAGTPERRALTLLHAFAMGKVRRSVGAGSKPLSLYFDTDAEWPAEVSEAFHSEEFAAWMKGGAK